MANGRPSILNAHMLSRAQIILRHALFVNSTLSADSRYNPPARPHDAHIKKVVWRTNLRELITGAGGFAGSHLAEYLLRNTHHTVWGCGISPKPPITGERPLPHRRLDLTDAAATSDYIAEIQPGSRPCTAAGLSHGEITRATCSPH